MAAKKARERAARTLAKVNVAMQGMSGKLGVVQKMLADAPRNIAGLSEDKMKGEELSLELGRHDEKLQSI